MIFGKRWIIVFCLIFISLFEGFSTSPWGLSYADSLFEAGNLRLAALEYERVFYLDRYQPTRNLALFRKAQAQKLEGEFEEATKTLQRIPLPLVSDSIRAEIIYEKALCYYLSFEYKLAEFELLRAKNLNKEKLPVREQILLILTLNELNKWQEAKSALIQLADYDEIPENIRQNIADKANLLYSKKNIPKLKNEMFQFWISFIPGTGIMYAGKPVEGAVNFLLNATCLSLGVLGIINGYYITGYFGGSVVMEKFYFGGRRRGEYLLEKHNKQKAQQFNSKIKEMVLALQLFEQARMKDEVKYPR